MQATTRRTDSTTSAPQPRAGHGAARFVGDAAPVAGIPLSRLLNAACYVISGIAVVVIATQVGHGGAGVVALGLAAVGYGIYIALSRGSYWVSSLVYVIAIIAVVGMFSSLAS